MKTLGTFPGTVTTRSPHIAQTIKDNTAKEWQIN